MKEPKELTPKQVLTRYIANDLRNAEHLAKSPSRYMTEAKRYDMLLRCIASSARNMIVAKDNEWVHLAQEAELTLRWLISTGVK